MIKHKAIGIAKTSPEQEWYLCNQAVKPNPDKLEYVWRKVTCKNCLKQIPETEVLVWCCGYCKKEYDSKKEAENCSDCHQSNEPKVLYEVKK